MKKLIFIVSSIVLLIIGFIAFEGASTSLDTKEFNIHKNSFSKWEDVFEKTPSLKVEIIKTGMMKASLSGILNFKHKNTKDLKDVKKEIPVLTILFSYNGKNYLIDTGLDSSFYKKNGNIKGLLVKSENYTLQKGEDIVNQLKKRNLTIDTVFFTHLHPDHMSAVPQLPSSTSFVFDKKETYINYPFLYGGDHLKGKKNLFTVNFEKSSNMPILGKCIDVFGNGSFWAISTPGHSTGHISYLIKSKNTVYLLTGDASISKWGFDNNVETGISTTGNREDAVASLKKLKKFYQKYKTRITIVFGHEVVQN